MSQKYRIKFCYVKYVKENLKIYWIHIEYFNYWNFINFFIKIRKIKKYHQKNKYHLCVVIIINIMCCYNMK